MFFVTKSEDLKRSNPVSKAKAQALIKEPCRRDAAGLRRRPGSPKKGY